MTYVIQTRWKNAPHSVWIYPEDLGCLHPDENACRVTNPICVSCSLKRFNEQRFPQGCLRFKGLGVSKRPFSFIRWKNGSVLSKCIQLILTDLSSQLETILLPPTEENCPGYDSKLPKRDSTRQVARMSDLLGVGRTILGRCRQMAKKKAPPRTMAESVRRFRKICIKREGDKPIKLAGGLVINKKKDPED